MGKRSEQPFAHFRLRYGTQSIILLCETPHENFSAIEFRLILHDRIMHMSFR